MATLTSAKRLVVKIGSALLVDRNTGLLRSDWLHSLAQDVAWLKGQGTDVILVSSGSIALGRRVLGPADGNLAAGTVAGRCGGGSNPAGSRL